MSDTDPIVAELREQLETARATNERLNRRCQRAESELIRDRRRHRDLARELAFHLRLAHRYANLMHRCWDRLEFWARDKAPYVKEQGEAIGLLVGTLHRAEGEAEAIREGLQGIYERARWEMGEAIVAGDGGPADGPPGLDLAPMTIERAAFRILSENPGRWLSSEGIAREAIRRGYRGHMGSDEATIARSFNTVLRKSVGLERCKRLFRLAGWTCEALGLAIAAAEGAGETKEGVTDAEA